MRAALVVLLVVACAPPAKVLPDAGVALKVAAFTLEDVNPASPRFGQQVGPADYGGKVTGWYFGHSS